MLRVRWANDMTNQASGRTATHEPGEVPKYWAFISYSHRDMTWGNWLHKALETYHVPRHLVGRPSRDGKVPRRLYPVFRDREELPTSASLSGSVTHALRQSRYLVVICSPSAAASRWVNQEVLFFKALGRDDHILSLIVDGSPNATDNPQRGVPECFPPALRYHLAPSGELTEEQTEPIAADVRPGKDDKVTAKLRLLAGLLGVSFDELKQRERQRLVRRRMLWTILATGVLLLLAGVWQWQEGRRREQARQGTIAQLTEAGRQELLAGESRRATVYLSEAYRLGGNQAALRVMLAAVLRPLDAEVGTLRGHSESVNLATYSPDGSRILTVSDDGHALIWDARAHKPVAKLTGHKWFVRSGGFLSDSRAFTVGSEDVVKLWDARSGELLATLHGERANARPDGRQLVTALNGEAILWDTETGQRIRALKAPTLHLADIAFSPDGLRVAGGGGLDVDPPPEASPRGRIWDAETGEVLTYLEGHTGAINSVAFSPDGTQVVTASTDRTAKVWDAHDGRLIVSLGEHPGSVPLAIFSPDGKSLLTFSEQVAALWNLAAPEQPIIMLHEQWINDASFSPDGTRVVTAANDNSAYIWDAAFGQQLLSLDGHTQRVQTARFSRDGESVVTASLDRRAMIWSLRSTAVTVLTPAQRVSGASFDATGRRLAVAGEQAEIWDVASKTAIQAFDPHPQWGVRTIGFSPDGGRLITASEDRTSKVLNAATGQIVADFRGHEARVMSASFSSDGRRVVSAALDHTVQIWDAATGALVLRMKSPHGQVAFAAFSPDDKQVAVAAGLAVGIWDATTGQGRVQLPEQTTGPHRVAFHPQGQQIAATDGDLVSLWDLSTQKQITTYVGHLAQVNSLAFHSDGTLLATGSSDGTVRLWDVNSGKLLLVLQGHRAEVNTVAFRPDGQFLVSSSSDGTVRLWDVSQESRAPKVVTALVGERVPLKTVDGRLVPK